MNEREHDLPFVDAYIYPSKDRHMPYAHMQASGFVNLIDIPYPVAEAVIREQLRVSEAVLINTILRFTSHASTEEALTKVRESVYQHAAWLGAAKVINMDFEDEEVDLSHIPPPIVQNIAVTGDNTLSDDARQAAASAFFMPSRIQQAMDRVGQPTEE